MTSPEAVLQRAAEDGSLDPAEWPHALQYILDRLDEIIQDFPKPVQPVQTSSHPQSPSHTQLAASSKELQTGDKENAAPVTPSRPAVPIFSSTPDAQGLPQETINTYSAIRATLIKCFPKDAPHTIQRLAELILEPHRRYKYLPPYLRALDRVVSVTSQNSLFPLPQAVLPATAGVLNGGTTSLSQSALGSDESLGGALLTPIPWLQSRGAQNELISESTEMVDGPNGAGRIETVTVGLMNNSHPTVSQPPSHTANVLHIASSHPDGETLPSTGAVTQGEILRQEQEAGIVLKNPHSLPSNMRRNELADMGGNDHAVLETVEPEDEKPHARGPEIIGMADTGPQNQTASLDIEGAVGRPSMKQHTKSPEPVTAKDEDMEDVGVPVRTRKEGHDGAIKAANTEESSKAKTDEMEKTTGVEESL